MGKPQGNYPWPWSIYRYLPGESIASTQMNNLNHLAVSLAEFLSAFQAIDTSGGPLAGTHSFYRGDSLKVYDDETKGAIANLKKEIDVGAVTKIWDAALASTWEKPPVWVHGDLSAGNLLVQNGQLSAVIDFGQLAIGDPACDLAIAWTLFEGKSRETFRAALSLDDGTWVRGRGWALWKALITAANITTPSNYEANHCWKIIDDIIAYYKSGK
jgi:aminoglycoside phosphotransferase (APT) family kinase protein